MTEFYKSIEAAYELDASKIFEVVAELGEYAKNEETVVKLHSPGVCGPLTKLSGIGRKLILKAAASKSHGIYDYFDLAELVLSDDAQKLTLLTHEQEKVYIQSGALETIAKKYQKK